MLKKWFPQMENFSGQLKKYKVTINDLLEENQKLEARARASESGKMKDRMERAKLESELQTIQRLVDRIPPDILAEAKRLDNKSCPGCGKIITAELEAVTYQQMVKKLDSYKTLTGRKKAAKTNPKIAVLQVELAHVDSEIEKLVDSLTGANNVLLSYVNVNVKIVELDGRKQELLAQIAELTVEAISPEQVNQISGYLDTWENVSFDDKRRVVDLMLTTIAATSDSLNITWKI